MSRRRGPASSNAARTILATAVAMAVVAASLAGAASARATEPPTFQPGTLTSSFPEPVSWRFTFSTAADPTRVEVLTRLGNSGTAFVSVVSAPELTRQSDGTWLVSGRDDGAVTPNTPYRARLRVTTADGTFLGPEATVLVSDDRFKWQTSESSRLRAHWYTGSAAFGARILDVGEKGVEKAEDFLGIHLPGKVDVFIYADEAAFRDAIGAGHPENTAGVPFPDISTLFALIRPEQVESSFVADVVPHELTHLVIHAGLGPDVDMPLWLDEGFAVYLSVGYTAGYRDLVRRAIADGTLLPLDGLSGDFPTDAAGDRSIAAYGEGVSAVDFMARTYGQAKIAAMMDVLGSQGADPAFRQAFGTDTAGVGAAWLDDLGAKAPKAYGPRPAPAGPVPPDWAGPPPAAGLLPAASPPASAPPSSAPTPGPGSVVPPPASSGASPVAVAVLIATGLLAAVAVAGAMLARRRRPH
jgi:hypothetical protein